MQKLHIEKIHTMIAKIGKASQETLGTWPGNRFENPRPFEWIIRPK